MKRPLSKILRYFMRRLNFMTVCVNVWTLSREINFVVVVAKKATMAMLARRDKGVHAQRGPSHSLEGRRTW
jgi:hypothetical protein